MSWRSLKRRSRISTGTDETEAELKLRESDMGRVWEERHR
jgi:hypothetical protein